MTGPASPRFGSVLVTGGAGFIGSHLVDALLGAGASRVVVLDKLSIGGSRANLEQHRDNSRLDFVQGDVCDPQDVAGAVRGVDVVVHAAAESHVDRSIDEPRSFLETNVMGTGVVLETCLRLELPMILISTDEVYGPGDPGGGLFDEDAAPRPRSPYAASKAGADLLCQAATTTYGANVIVVRGTNAFGPRQIEKVIPTYTVNALEGRPVPVYGRGLQHREYLHVTDWVAAVLVVLERGDPGTVYNIGGGTEIENVELARRICGLVGASEALISFVPDRPGHDFRYGVSSERIRGLGWTPTIEFDPGLAQTVEWYRENLAWLRTAHPGEIVTPPRMAETSG